MLMLLVDHRRFITHKPSLTKEIKKVISEFLGTHPKTTDPLPGD